MPNASSTHTTRGFRTLRLIWQKAEEQSMAFTLFTDLFNTIDTTTATFVTDISSNAITALLPIVTVAMTVGFLVYGSLILRGVIDMPLLDFVSRSFKIGIVLSFAMMGGIYQSQIAGVIQQ